MATNSDVDSVVVFKEKDEGEKDKNGGHCGKSDSTI